MTRFLLRGGLLGLGHVNKGTPEMGNPVYEYEYVDQYLKRSSFGLMMLDLWVIWRGVLVIVKGAFAMTGGLRRLLDGWIASRCSQRR